MPQEKLITLIGNVRNLNDSPHIQWNLYKDSETKVPFAESHSEHVDGHYVLVEFNNGAHYNRNGKTLCRGITSEGIWGDHVKCLFGVEHTPEDAYSSLYERAKSHGKAIARREGRKFREAEHPILSSS